MVPAAQGSAAAAGIVIRMLTREGICVIIKGEGNRR